MCVGGGRGWVVASNDEASVTGTVITDISSSHVIGVYLYFYINLLSQNIIYCQKNAKILY